MTPEVEKRYAGCPDPLAYVRREVLVWFVRLMPVINVDRVKEIPCDWPGLMGVPISFLDKIHPDQFEIVGMSLELADMKPIRERLGRNDGGPTFYIERGGKLMRLYDRIVIRRRK